MLHAFAGANEERADDGGEDAAGGDGKGKGHGFKRAEGGNTEGGSGDDGADVGFIEIGAHTGNVANVIANVIGDDGGVAGVIFGDTGFNFTNEVGADVSGFGVSAATDTGEEGGGRGAHTKGDHGGGEGRGVKVEANFKNEVPEGDIEEAETNNGETHNGAGGEGDVKAFVKGVAAGVSGAGVGAGGDTHADEAGEGAAAAAGGKAEGNEPAEEAEGGHNGKDNDHNAEVDSQDSVLAAEVSEGAGVDGIRKLLHFRGAGVGLQNFRGLNGGKDEGGEGAGE